MELATKADILNLKNKIVAEIKDVISNQQPRLLKPRDVQDYLGCESKVNALRKSGRLPAKRVGGSFTFYWMI